MLFLDITREKKLQKSKSAFYFGRCGYLLLQWQGEVHPAKAENLFALVGVSLEKRAGAVQNA
jgi:hypothetical protein